MNLLKTLYNNLLYFLISKSKIFDKQWYLQEYSDVKKNGIDPLKHFINYGFKEGRKPNKNFPTLYYQTKFNKLNKYLKVFLLYYFNYFYKSDNSKYYTFQSVLNPDLKLMRKKNILFSKSRLYIYLLLNLKIRFTNFSNPKLSIIIVSFNTPELLLYQLLNLSRIKSTSFEIIIIDNGSKKFTQLLLNKMEGIVIKRNKSNLGFPKAVNQGYKLTKSPIIVLLNSDAIPIGNWADKLISNFEDPKIKILGAKIINSKFKIQEAGNLLWDDGICQRIAENYSIDSFKANRIGITDFCSACFLAIKKNILDEKGVFDEIYTPAYYEDVDFALNMRNKGFDTYYDSSISVFHLENASSNSVFAQNQIKINWNKFNSKNNLLLKELQTRESDPGLLEEKVTAQLLNNQILVIDSLFPSEQNGQGAPRLKEIVKVLANDRNYVDVLFRQGSYESISSSFPILPTGILEISGPLNDELLKLAIESKYRNFTHFWISRIENLLWLKDSGWLDKFLLQGKVIFDFEAVRLEQINTEVLSILKSINKIIVVNELDRNHLKSNSLEANIIGYIPSNILINDSPNNSRDIIFVGNLENIDSDNVKSLIAFRRNLEYFKLSSVELILSRLKIYGKYSEQTKLLLEKNGFILRGFEPDSNSIFSNAKLFISPSLDPQGIPLKLKLAKSYCVPCLVTKELGVQLNWRNNIDAFISENGLDFISTLINLLENDQIISDLANKLKLSNSNTAEYSEFKESILSILS